MNTRRCNWCGQSAVQFTCEGLEHVLYCNRDCQRHDWEEGYLKTHVLLSQVGLQIDLKTRGTEQDVRDAVDYIHEQVVKAEEGNYNFNCR